MQRFNVIILLGLVTFARTDNNLSIGRRESGDRLFQEQNIRKGGRPWSIEEEATIMGDYWITFVDVVDLKKEETSGIPLIVSGGPGHTYVALKFENKRFHGIDFLVKVYGKPIS